MFSSHVNIDQHGESSPAKQYICSPRMSDTPAPVERARVLVSTKNDVLETRKEAIQTSIKPE